MNHIEQGTSIYSDEDETKRGRTYEEITHKVGYNKTFNSNIHTELSIETD